MCSMNTQSKDMVLKGRPHALDSVWLRAE